METTYILTLSCSQRPGIVHAVTAFLFQHGCDIVEHQQFDDTNRDTFFLRTEFVSAHDPDTADLSAAFGREVAEKFGMSFTLDRDRPQRALVMVSRMGHCLNDLFSVGVPAASAPISSRWCPATRICGPWPRR